MQSRWEFAPQQADYQSMEQKHTPSKFIDLETAQMSSLIQFTSWKQQNFHVTACLLPFKSVLPLRNKGLTRNYINIYMNQHCPFFSKSTYLTGPIPRFQRRAPRFWYSGFWDHILTLHHTLGNIWADPGWDNSEVVGVFSDFFGFVWDSNWIYMTLKVHEVDDFMPCS